MELKTPFYWGKINDLTLTPHQAASLNFFHFPLQVCLGSQGQEPGESKILSPPCMTRAPDGMSHRKRMHRFPERRCLQCLHHRQRVPPSKPPWLPSLLTTTNKHHSCHHQCQQQHRHPHQQHNRHRQITNHNDHSPRTGFELESSQLLALWPSEINLNYLSLGVLIIIIIIPRVVRIRSNRCTIAQDSHHM